MTCVVITVDEHKFYTVNVNGTLTCCPLGIEEMSIKLYILALVISIVWKLIVIFGAVIISNWMRSVS